MNTEQIRQHSAGVVPEGYQMIMDDVDEQYIYLSLKRGDMKETTRQELVEIIESGKPLPPLEIRKRN